MIPKCVRVGCEDGRIWGTDWCLRHTGDTEADVEVHARLDALVGGRTAELHGVTSRDGNVRRMNPGERPVPGDLLPDGRVLADGTLEPYPEDVARARDVIATLDPEHPDTVTVRADLAAAAGLADPVRTGEPARPGWLLRAIQWVLS